MNKSDSIEAQNLNAIPMNDQTKRKKEKQLVKNLVDIAAFDYADKIFIVLSTYFDTLSIVSHATVIGIPVGLAGASLTVVFSLPTGIVKKLLNVTRKKRKNNKIIMLAKSKLNSIETLMSQALIDLDISHEEFKTIVNEKEKYEQMKESIRNTKSRDELSENSREIKENNGNA